MTPTIDSARDALLARLRAHFERPGSVSPAALGMVALLRPSPFPAGPAEPVQMVERTVQVPVERVTPAVCGHAPELARLHGDLDTALARIESMKRDIESLRRSAAAGAAAVKARESALTQLREARELAGALGARIKNLDDAARAVEQAAQARESNHATALAGLTHTNKLLGDALLAMEWSASRTDVASPTDSRVAANCCPRCGGVNPREYPHGYRPISGPNRNRTQPAGHIGKCAIATMYAPYAGKK